MFYESRYTTVDYCHRLFEVVRFMFVSTAIVHVGSIDLMSDARSSATMIFCVAALGEGMMYLGLNVEVLLMGQGDRGAITNHTKRMIRYMLPTLSLYAAAVVVSIWLYVRPDDGKLSPHGRFLANLVDDKDGNYSSNYDKTDWMIDDLPLTLMAVAYIQNIVSTLVLEVRAGKKGDVRTWFVPSNIDYVVHRYGEWCLLMIGEGKEEDVPTHCLAACASSPSMMPIGILSLLIVETDEITDYYIITTFGTLTMVSRVLYDRELPLWLRCL